MVPPEKVAAFKDFLKDSLKEIYNKIKGDDRYARAVIGGSVLVLAATGLIALTLKPADKSKSLTADNAFLQQKSLPDEFLNPFPDVPVRERIVEIIKEVPAPTAAIFDPRKLFVLREGRAPTASEEEKLRREMLDIRRQRSTIYIVPKKENPDFKTVTLAQDNSKDADYKKQKEEKIYASFPVDLSRTLTEDKFIPAVLINEINSELASDKVLAQIETDIYSAHGRHILIPKGSKAIGKYVPLQKQGDSRLQISWERIITPDGINIKINTETADQQGSSGMNGEVDKRLIDKYGMALLFSSISAVAQLSVNTSSQGQGAAASAFTQEFGTVTAELLRNSLDIAPRITIERGTRIIISPLTDLWFKEPEKNTTEIITLKEALK